MNESRADCVECGGKVLAGEECVKTWYRYDFKAKNATLDVHRVDVRCAACEESWLRLEGVIDAAVDRHKERAKKWQRSG